MKRNEQIMFRIMFTLQIAQSIWLLSLMQHMGQCR